MTKISRQFWLAACIAILSGQASAGADWKAFSTPGGQAPLPLILQDLNGNTVDLSSFKGQVVLINFWATWCEPCREEIPSLNRLQQHFFSRSFKVLGINIAEGRPRIAQFMERIPVTFTILRDVDSDVMKTWKVRILPTSFLIDKQGMLRYQLVGDANWDAAQLRAPILELLR